jgi:hypothetical protein
MKMDNDDGTWSGGRMKSRIARWAIAGALVAGSWAVFAVVTGPEPFISEPVVWTCARIMCPIALLGEYFHFGVKLYWVVASNAAAYAAVGLIVGVVRQRLSRMKAAPGQHMV